MIGADPTGPTTQVVVYRSRARIRDLRQRDLPEGWTGKTKDFVEIALEMRARYERARVALDNAREWHLRSTGRLTIDSAELLSAGREIARSRKVIEEVHRRILAAHKSFPAHGSSARVLPEPAKGRVFVLTDTIDGEVYSSRCSYRKRSYQWTLHAPIADVERALKHHPRAVIVRREGVEWVAYVPEFGRGFEARLRRELCEAPAVAQKAAQPNAETVAA